MMPFNNADGRQTPGAVFEKLIYSSKIQEMSRRGEGRVLAPFIEHLEIWRLVDMFAQNTLKFGRTLSFGSIRLENKMLTSL